jgi:hypothetical protein
VYQIEVQAQINVQVGEFLKINKRAVQNKHAGETSCKKNVKCTALNRLSRRKRGMASNLLFIIPDFFCIFPMNFAMATLGLKEMVKFLWEVREKSWPSWLSQFSFAKLRQPTGQTFFPTFPKVSLI